MGIQSGYPELGEKEGKILGIVKENWPISAMEIAEHFKEDLSSHESKKRQSTNYAYSLKKLVKRRLIRSKKIGRSLVVWPIEVEAYRAIHNIIKGGGF